MLPAKLLLCVLLTLPVISALQAQNTATINVKKEQHYFLFFQKEKKTDTINNAHNNVFYLLVPDTLKELLVFNSENAQIVKTKNDSLVKLNYLPGLKYEFIYEAEKKEFSTKEEIERKHNLKSGTYKTLINGTTELEPGKIRIQISHRKTLKLLHEINLFYMP